MSRSLTVVLAAAGSLLVMGPARAEQGSGGALHPTLWLGAPLVVHMPADRDGKLSIGLGSGMVYRNRSVSRSFAELDVVRTGFIAEAVATPQGENAGLAYSLRIGAGLGVYIAPGLFYVSRPKNGISGRFGAMVPMGDEVAPFLPEVSVGLRF
ncbi:MAG: hypothetical protein NT029_02750 [Armatimonadetes bacterium]|nr:hypothetical protein [Armatimonadota bacterium]